MSDEMDEGTARRQADADANACMRPTEDLAQEAAIERLWENAGHGSRREDLAAAYDAGVLESRKLFNIVIDFAIGQGVEAATFLTAWREGDASEWPEFGGA